MTTNTTTHHATERLLDIMVLGDSISARTAAEILGEGEDRARHFVREVAERKMASWSHSPSEGAPAQYIDHYNGTERDLPPVTADTTPDSVLLDCKDVLWLLCVKDVAKQTKVRLPPKELVQARFDALLAGDYTPQTEPASPAPVSRHTAQEDAVLAKLRAQGYDPTALPVNQSGLPGVKAQIRRSLEGAGGMFQKSSTTFNKTWERLRKAGEIADKA